jgi:hypothetical protein
MAHSSRGTLSIARDSALAPEACVKNRGHSHLQTMPLDLDANEAGLIIEINALTV